jgi:hypothetical protein
VEHGAEIGRIFAERRHLLASIAERFAMLTDEESAGKNRDVISQSVVHMHCTRLAGADRGIEERALGLLLRVCQSLKEAPIASPRALDADHS